MLKETNHHPSDDGREGNAGNQEKRRHLPGAENKGMIVKPIQYLAGWSNDGTIGYETLISINRYIRPIEDNPCINAKLCLIGLGWDTGIGKVPHGAKVGPTVGGKKDVRPVFCKVGGCYCGKIVKASPFTEGTGGFFMEDVGAEIFLDIG